MNYLKTKRTILILMLASYASAVCAAAQSEQPSLWQRAKDFVADHPVATGLIMGSAVAVGACEIIAHKFGLPTLSNAGMSALEKLKTDRGAQALAAGAAVVGAYSVAAKPLGLPTIVETIKKDLITGSEGQNENPALIYHVLHGGRLCAYGVALNLMVGPIWLKRRKHTEASQLIFENTFFPILEELISTYGARQLLGNDFARMIAPVFFGAMHAQYNIPVRVTCGMRSFSRHHSLHIRPEYSYAPIISHILHNAIAGNLGTINW